MKVPQKFQAQKNNPDYGRRVNDFFQQQHLEGWRSEQEKRREVFAVSRTHDVHQKEKKADDNDSYGKDEDGPVPGIINGKQEVAPQTQKCIEKEPTVGDFFDFDINPGDRNELDQDQKKYKWIQGVVPVNPLTYPSKKHSLGQTPTVTLLVRT